MRILGILQHCTPLCFAEGDKCLFVPVPGHDVSCRTSFPKWVCLMSFGRRVVWSPCTVVSGLIYIIGCVLFSKHDEIDEPTEAELLMTRIMEWRWA